LQKRPPNFVEKCYFLVELLIVKYRKQNISITNMALHKWTLLLISISVTLTNNIWFWQNFTSTVSHSLAVKVPNFCLIR